MEIFPVYAKKDSCIPISKTKFYKEYFLAIRKQVPILTEERLEQFEQQLLSVLFITS